MTKTETTTVQTPDPTSVEFGVWFRELMEEALDDNHPDRQLVIVIDNLDRVAPRDALSIWSTLQTFLQVGESQQSDWLYRVWVVVPYDATGLERVWNSSRDRGADRSWSDEDNADGTPDDVDGAENISAFLLDKILQVRFEAPPPVLSDWHDYVLGMLKQALPDHDPAEFHNVYRLYEQKVDSLGLPPTPRDLKLFVNGIGALHRQRQDEFPLSDLACYHLLRRDHVDIVSGLRNGQIPSIDMRSLTGAAITDSLAALLFNVEVELGRQLLLLAPIEDALRNADGAELKRLLAGRSGGFEVLEKVTFEEWSDDRRQDLLTSARSIFESGLLDEQADDHRVELENALRSLRVGLDAVDAWPQFTENVGVGIATVLKLFPEALFGRALLNAASTSSIAEEDGMIHWIDGILVVLREARRLGLTPAYSGGVVSPAGDAITFIAGCGSLCNRDQDGLFWNIVRPAESLSISDALISLIREEEPTEAHLSTIRVLKAAGHVVPWEELAGTIAERLRNLETLQLPQVTLLTMMLDELWYLAEQARNQFSALADQGYLLHFLEQSRPTDVTAVGWHMFSFLRQRPDGEVASHVGSSEAGLEFLTNILSSPEDAPSPVNAFVDNVVKYEEVQMLLEIIDAKPENRPFGLYTLKEFLARSDVAQLITPELLKQRWQLFAEALVDAFDDFVRRLIQVHEVTKYLRQEAFNEAEAGLYAAVIRAEEGGDQEFTDWCLAALASVKGDSWQAALTQGRGLSELMVDLERNGTHVALGQAYVDGMEGYSRSLMAGVNHPERSPEERQQLIDVLQGEFRTLLRVRMYEAATEADGEISEAFFNFYGSELSDRAVLDDRRTFLRLFEPLLSQRNARGLEWLAEFFEHNPSFHESYSPSETVGQFKTRVSQYFADPEPFEERVNSSILRIAEALGVPIESGEASEGEDQEPKEES